VNLVETIEAMPAAERRGALAILDLISRPLSPREIEGALRARGVPRSRAVILAGSLTRLIHRLGDFGLAEVV
jgi:hypothetical protein